MPGRVYYTTSYLTSRMSCIHNKKQLLLKYLVLLTVSVKLTNCNHTESRNHHELQVEM